MESSPCPEITRSHFSWPPRSRGSLRVNAETGTSEKVRRKWPLQQKAWLVTASVLVGLAGLIAIGVDAVFRHGSAELENQWVEESVRRVQAAQAAEVENLERCCRDYANWVDTYAFIDDPSLPYIATGVLELPATWDSYLAGRSENLLANLRRRQHKVEREYGPATLEVLDAEGDVPAGVGHYSDLESSGWKARRGTALARGNRQWRFYCDAMQSFCRDGRGRIHVLRFGDRVAAACLSVVAEKTAYLLKTTYNESMRSVAPGMFLRRYFIESLYSRDAGVRRIEIYGSLNESQRPWVTGVRQMYHANAYRGPVVAVLHTLSRRVKQPFRALAPGD